MANPSSFQQHAFIEQLAAKLSFTQPSSIEGIGEDAAVMQCTDQQMVVSTHLHLEGIHFDLSYTPLQHAGYKAVVRAISKILAMYATPTQVLVGLGLSNRFTQTAVDTLYQGIQQACQQYQLDLMGGDTTSTSQGLILSITAVGHTPMQQLGLRQGAQPHDIVYLTGDVGAAYVGLQILEREKQVWQADPNMQPQLKEHQYVLQRQLKPLARTDIIQTLKKKQLQPTSIIKVSSGVALAALQLAKAAQKGIQLYEDKLPVAKETYETAIDLRIDPTICALHGGEDEELLFTMRPADFATLEHHPDVSEIGYITDVSSGCNLVTKARKVIPLTTPGWTC